jgi:hypothetical protein
MMSTKVEGDVSLLQGLGTPSTRQYAISERDEYNYESKVHNHLDELSEHSSRGLLTPTSTSSTTSTGTQGSEHET